MLRIYPVVLGLLEGLEEVVGGIERRDRDLARQLRRCSASVALNLAEGMYIRGGRFTSPGRSPNPGVARTRA